MIDKSYKSGDMFGRIMLTGKSFLIKQNRLVEYICSCGKIKWSRLLHIKNGAVLSCGCLSAESSKIRATKHGMYGNSLYVVWRGMLQRCYDKKHPAYSDYGGRGVIVCPEWKNSFISFYGWAKDKWKSGLELDKDKLSPNQVGNQYCPKYCSFITSTENKRNTRKNRMIQYKGENKCLSEWICILGLNYKTVHGRLTNLKWSIEDAFENK